MAMTKLARLILGLPEKRKHPTGPAPTPTSGAQAPYKLEAPITPVPQPLKPVK